MYVYFAKDVLVGVTYLSFLSSTSGKETQGFRPPFRYALGVFVLLGLVQVFNPFSPSIFYGILGLKLYFYYVPLCTWAMRCCARKRTCANSWWSACRWRE